MRLALLIAMTLFSAVPAQGAIKGPEGMRVQTVARGVGHPSNIAFDPAGGIWTTSAAYGVEAADGVWYVKRKGAKPVHVVHGLNSALGLTWFRNELYVSHVLPYSAAAGTYTGRVTAYSGFNGKRFKRKRTVVKGIPTGLHRVNSIVARGGRFYMGVGSAGDTTAGSKYGGTVVSFKPGGKGLRIEARGLRNPYGLAFAPDGATLLVSDNGRDDLGNGSPPDELNQFVISDGGTPHFGFPRCWGRGGGRCGGTVAPLAELAPHSAAGGVATAERFGKFGPSAFVTEHGSTIASPPTGNVVVRVPLTGQRSKDVGFARGFGKSGPLGIALGPSGQALYVTLQATGRIIRFVP